MVARQWVHVKIEPFKAEILAKRRAALKAGNEEAYKTLCMELLTTTEQTFQEIMSMLLASIGSKEEIFGKMMQVHMQVPENKQIFGQIQMQASTN